MIEKLGNRLIHLRTVSEGAGRMRGLLRRKFLPDRRVEGFGYPTIIRNFSISMKVETGYNKLEPSRGVGRMLESGKPNLDDLSRG